MEASERTSDGFGTPSYKAYALTALLVIYIFNAIDRVLLGVLQEYIRADLKLTDFQLGLLGGPAFVILYTISGIPIARYAERANRIQIVAIGAGVWSIATATCGLAVNFATLAMSRIAVGIGEAACIPPSHSAISDYYSPKRRATAMAIFGLGIPLGTLTAALLAGNIAENFGWRAAFFALGIPGVIAAIVLKLTVKDPPRAGTAKEVPSLQAAFKFLVSKKSFVWVTLGAISIAIFGFATNHFMVSYLVRQYDLAVDQAAPIFGLVLGVGAAVGIFLGGFLADRFSPRHPRVLAWLPALAIMAAVPFYLFAFSQNSLPLAVVFLLTAAILHYFCITPQFTIAQIVAEPRMRATSSALVLTIVTLVGYGLGPPLVGGVADMISNGQLVEMGIQPEDCFVQQMSESCRVAGGSGLRFAFKLSLIFVAFASFCYWQARKTLLTDKYA